MKSYLLLKNTYKLTAFTLRKSSRIIPSISTHVERNALMIQSHPNFIRYNAGRARNIFSDHEFGSIYVLEQAERLII